ncbi:MAG TPA: ABC transporter ATP-binding protein [Polyangiaceae bacterium]|jgi:peptide/nickel transport system ATP-binding protein/oligopeptide transport system ATP-binding protein|nr:ABC transporter ATP-binding protein [Polyangiaceae bacterium]
MLLEVQRLKTHFFTEDGVVRAVDGISYSVDRGEVLGIVGESGSGKSVSSLSTMRLIPDPPGRIVAGKILLESKGGRTIDLAAASETEMQRIRGKRVAMIFQDPMTSLNPYLTISDQLVEVLVLHEGLPKKAARDRAVEMLKAVGIPDPSRRLDDHPHQLSGGMRQRVMIAMALLCTPELLIADEPTTALDVTTQAQILDLILDRKDALQKDGGRGLGVVLITHDLGVVARAADRVAVMYAGHIVEEAPVAALFADPRHPYTVGLRRSIPSLEGDRKRRLVPIPGMPPSLSHVPKGCPFAPRCPAARADCKETFPEMREVGPGHRVACHETDVELVRRPPKESAA